MQTCEMDGMRKMINITHSSQRYNNKWEYLTQYHRAVIILLDKLKNRLI